MNNLEVTIAQNVDSLKFASNVISSNLEAYQKRGQVNIKKIFDDIYNGKICEFAVFNFLMLKGKGCTPPDLKIYDKMDKSFDCDLMSREKRIHVKSCRSNSDSWVFEKNDPLVTNPTDNDYIFLCKTDKNKVNIIKILKAKDAEYKNPILKHLTTKVCIYN